MKRNALTNLKQWLTSVNRKPLVLRGARQVGKTWLVRDFAKSCGKQLIEINFEKQPARASIFSSNDPKRILLNLSALLHQEIKPENCLLFLDEIQSSPEILSKLRWFAEDMPELPVIAAGSLLDFVLAEHSFSMPVGRISYMHIEPMTFEEFLLAQNKETLCDYLATYHFAIEIPEAIHEQFMMLFKEYLLVGGLPAVVFSWITEHSLNRINQIQNDLLATYRDDFSKYKGKIAAERLDEVMTAIPKMLGQKVVFSRINPEIKSTTMKQVMNLLSKAKICHRVNNCAANGVPLGAEIKDNYFKGIFLDTGLCGASLGLNLHEINHASDITLINNGGIAEQVVGQMLRTINPFYIEPTLYYWARDEKGASAEIDYIIQYGSKIIPIEVKAGSTGSLKSLHLYMGLKKLPLAVRIYSGLPNKTNMQIKDRSGEIIEYKLISIPFYAVNQIYRLLDREFHA